MVHLWTISSLPHINLHERNVRENVWSLITSFVLQLCIERYIHNTFVIHLDQHTLLVHDSVFSESHNIKICVSGLNVHVFTAPIGLFPKLFALSI